VVLIEVLVVLEVVLDGRVMLMRRRGEVEVVDGIVGTADWG
jgi:hypothetical protein